MRFKAFCIIPHQGEIEIKPLVLCKECKHYAEEMDVFYCKLHGWWRGGDWFCADGAKGEETPTVDAEPVRHVRKMRMIDADALIEKMQRVVDRHSGRYSSTPFIGLTEVIKWINAEADQDHAQIRISYPTNGEGEEDAAD